MSFRILLADHRYIHRKGYRALFSDEFSLVASIDEASSVDTFQHKLAVSPFDLIIVHQNLVTNLALLPRDHFVLLAIQPNTTLFQAAVEYGALGYLSENTSPELLKITLMLHSGDFLIEPAFVCPMLEVLAADNKIADIVNMLTRREQEVFTLRQRGLSVHEIAERLYITENTVKRHLANIAVKIRQKRKKSNLSYSTYLSNYSEE
jgi:DNA-binding NarL/FixJ family response regulator